MSKIKQEEMVKIFNAIYKTNFGTIEGVYDYIERLQNETVKMVTREKSILKNILKVINNKIENSAFKEIIEIVKEMENHKNSSYIYEKILHNCFIKSMKNPDCFEKLIY